MNKISRTQTRSSKLREELGYFVIDTDFHTNEFQPVLLDYIDKVGGAKSVDKFRAMSERGYVFGKDDWYALSPAERMRRRVVRPPWWTVPSKKTVDYATSSIPHRLHERLYESGTDFAVLYPNISMLAVGVGDEELRRTFCRAFNLYHADIYRDYADRITPVAAIPLHTPHEGIEELEFAVKELGFKTTIIPGALKRPIAALAEKYPAGQHPDIAPYTTWLDTLGLDSLHDYDPFWAKLIELGVTATTHTAGMGWTARSTTNSYMYNHIGHFADASHAFAKSLFMGGVTRRFPKLRVGFLEGGAAWAAALYCDLVGHWEKRGAPQILNYNPTAIDEKELVGIYRSYGDSLYGDRVFDDRALFKAALATGQSTFDHPEDPNAIDDFALAGITSVEDIRDRFVPNFYFGAESDDPTVAHAFNSKVNPLGVKLNAFRATDSGHWDVPDLGETLWETWELVQRGALTEADFKNLVHTNPYRFYTDANPDFFKGTAIEPGRGRQQTTS